MTIDRSTHLKRVREACEEIDEFRHHLVELGSENVDPWTGYIWVVADTTRAFLDAAERCLNQDGIYAEYDDIDFRNLMVAIHSSFFNRIHSVLEIILEGIISELDIAINTDKPDFMTKANAVLGFVFGHDAEMRTKWRLHFDGLRILRNKVSHANPKLREDEQETLRQGGFEVAMDGDMPSFNPRMYRMEIDILAGAFFSELREGVKSNRNRG